MVTISKEKSKEFIQFLKENAKDKQFWEENKKFCSQDIDKEEIEKLFKENN